MPIKANGFITLHRQILDWEWYKNTNTKVLFLHLLLKANYKDLQFEGKTILRSQLVTSLPSLSSELGLSVRQIRVSLDHLIATGEVTSKSYPKYRVITIVKYDQYQMDDSQNDSQMTGETAVKRQASDSQMTGKRQANDRQMTASKQYNNINKGTKEQCNNDRERDRERSAKRFIPPTAEEVTGYCESVLLYIGFDSQHFVDYYTANGWMVGKNNKMRDWKATVRNWIRRDEKEKLKKKQQEYDLPY